MPLTHPDWQGSVASAQPSINIARFAPNAHGVSNQATAQWWHAVDLVSAGMWRELLETRRFTTDDDIAGAVAYGLDYSPHDGSKDGYLTIAEARSIMAAVAIDEPDRASALLAMKAPSPCKQDHKQAHWPINCAYGTTAGMRAWARILGIEAGWFARDRAGFLQWTEQGRGLHVARGSATYVEAGGQSAFAF